jgi:hypothetical protein
MRQVMVVVSVLALAFSACGDDDDGATTDGGECTCPTPSAQQINFDNGTSTLGAENVQDALDELAQRPLGEPSLAGRITQMEKELDNAGGEILSGSISCPEGDIALGGGCGFLLGGGVLTSAGGGGGIYGCSYQQPAGNTAKPTISVMCFHPADAP